MLDAVKILLVDDEQRNLDSLDAILDDPGYLLFRARDADRALNLLLEHDFAAIVLDIKMPGVSGIELARLIKGTKRFREIPLVFLTAYLFEDRDVLTGYGAGAADYLTKPVNPQILRHKVAVFAELFRKTRALAELNENLEARVQERTSELARSEAALRAADHQKDLFLATLAHELRNPLAPLRTGLDILLHEREQCSPPVSRALGAMNRQLDHMVRLVDDLVDVSRVSRGVLEMRKEDTELRSVVEEGIDIVTPSLVRRKQSVTVDAEGTFPVHVDTARVAQIVANLLDNSSKYSPPEADLRVEIRSTEHGATVRVVDRGAGIPVDQIDRIFEMFTKVERADFRPSEGLGIGLALSRHLAMLHGGSLTVESAGEGQGAAFTLSLPTETAPRAPSDSVKPSPSPRDEPLRKPSIVVIEDNEDAADTLADWLQDLGHEVRVARTGPAGLALVLSARPDVVLCDVGLPGMDGVEVCRQVVAKMPVPPMMVALTGWSAETDRRRTHEAGFKHHLVKPVAPEALRALLQSAEGGG